MLNLYFYFLNLLTIICNIATTLIKIKYYTLGKLVDLGWYTDGGWLSLDKRYKIDLFREHYRGLSGCVEPTTGQVWPRYHETRVEFLDGTVTYLDSVDIHSIQTEDPRVTIIVGDKGMNPLAKVIDYITYDTTSQMIFLFSVVGIILGGSCVIYYCYKRKQEGKPVGKSKGDSESKPSEGSENKPEGGLDDSVKITEGSMLEENNTTLINFFDRFWDPFL